MKRKYRILSGILALLLALSLSGCNRDLDNTAPQDSPSPSAEASPPVSTAEPSSEPEQTPKPDTPVEPLPEPEQTPGQSETTPSPEPSDDVTTPEPDNPADFLSVPDKEAIRAVLREAIVNLLQPVKMDISAVELSAYPEMDIQNLYNEILSESPALKYAHALHVTVEDHVLTCQIQYMPYKTGDFPEGFEGTPISSLSELIAAAQAGLGTEPVAIHITNRELEPDVMNRALQQAGGGMILCMLNSDATQIQFSAPMGMTMEEGLASLAEVEALADAVVSEVVTDDMTEYEKATALYSYITERVEYDQRYYSDKSSMPYHSQTALGALRDGMAICGGYSHAIQLLFARAGIPCYNVTGQYYAEYHMWNIAFLDGQWLYFDATSDRGSSAEIGFRSFAMSELDARKYKWDAEAVLQFLEQL